LKGEGGNFIAALPRCVMYMVILRHLKFNKLDNFIKWYKMRLVCSLFENWTVRKQARIRMIGDSMLNIGCMINYLKAAGLRVGFINNFGRGSLE
jgi:hypothetical protein